jgi:hypothetical protein
MRTTSTGQSQVCVGLEHGPQRHGRRENVGEYMMADASRTLMQDGWVSAYVLPEAPGAFRADAQGDPEKTPLIDCIEAHPPHLEVHDPGL